MNDNVCLRVIIINKQKGVTHNWHIVRSMKITCIGGNDPMHRYAVLPR